MENPEKKHLWEHEHPYYCLASDSEKEYFSWSKWMEENRDMDIDWNLIFRWDWEDQIHVGGGLLYLHVFHQRRGKSSTHIIHHMKHEDEESVRKILLKHWTRNCENWAPLAIDLPHDNIVADFLEERGLVNSADTIRLHRFL